MCYAPSLLMSVVLVVKGLDDSTRFGLQFGTIVVYFNSMLNTILYCWKIKELKDSYCSLSSFIQLSIQQDAVRWKRFNDLLHYIECDMHHPFLTSI